MSRRLLLPVTSFGRRLLRSADGISARRAIALPLTGVSGFKISKASDSTITVTAGEVRDSTNAFNLFMAASTTKSLASAFAAGTGNGMLDTGSEATSTLYDVYAIGAPGVTTDIACCVSAAAISLPAGFTYARYLGSFFNNSGGNIVAMIHEGDYFRYTGTLTTDLNDATITTNTYEAVTLIAPPFATAHFYAGVNNDTETASGMKFNVRPVGAADDLSAGLHATGRFEIIPTAVTVVGNNITVAASCLTNASRQVEYAATEGAGTASVRIVTYAFTAHRRSNP